MKKLYKSAAFSLSLPVPPLTSRSPRLSSLEKSHSSTDGVRGIGDPVVGLLIQRDCLLSNFNDIPSAYHFGCLATGFELGLSFDSHTSDPEKHFFSRPQLLILSPLKPFPLRCQYGWAARWWKEGKGEGRPVAHRSHIKASQQSLQEPFLTNTNSPQKKQIWLSLRSVGVILRLSLDTLLNLMLFIVFHVVSHRGHPIINKLL